MTTLLEKQRSAASNLQSPDDATLDQVLTRIATLAPMVARLAPTLSKVGGCRRSSCPPSGRHGFTACSYLDVTAALNSTRRAPFGRSPPLPGSMGPWAGMP
jgi:hypothetical protein